jgi:hypothetical protein
MLFMRSGVLLFFSRSAAILLASCLLVAPLCASRCNLASCLLGVPQQSGHGCHHEFAQAGGNAISFLSILSTSCQNTDSLFIAPPVQQLRLWPSVANLHPLFLALPIDLFYPAPSGGTDVFLARDSSPGSASSAPTISPLRV